MKSLLAIALLSAAALLSCPSFAGQPSFKSNSPAGPAEPIREKGVLDAVDSAVRGGITSRLPWPFFNSARALSDPKNRGFFIPGRYYKPAPPPLAEGQKPPVLLIHGLLLDAAGSWKNFKDVFGDTFDIYAPNWHFPVRDRWTDISKMRDWELKDATFEQLVVFYKEEAVRIALETGRKPIVFGHSLGARVASRLDELGLVDMIAEVNPAPHSGVASLKPSSFKLLKDALLTKLKHKFGPGDSVIHYTPEQFADMFFGHERGAFGSASVDAESLFREHGLPLPPSVLIKAVAHTGPAYYTNTPRIIIGGGNDTVCPLEQAYAMAGQRARTGGPLLYIEKDATNSSHPTDVVEYLKTAGLAVDQNVAQANPPVAPAFGAEHGSTLLDFGVPGKPSELGKRILGFLSSRGLAPGFLYNE